MSDSLEHVSTTSTGLAPNVSGALAYLLGPITGIVFLLMEKDSRYVRFHAAQSIGVWVAFLIVSVVLTVISGALSAIPVLGWLFALVFLFVSLGMTLVGLALWLFLMYKGYSGEEWEFPFIGRQVRSMLFKGEV
ncbi:MAG: DUF4870 domain-containing protein [Gemmatimonadales bacterium]|nr:MAG: DUF4870 domain-containing protein [Gemmatimonadales bacterium]